LPHPYFWWALKYEKRVYNTRTDFVDIIAIAKYTFALAVRSDAPWKTYEELIEWSKKESWKI